MLTASSQKQIGSHCAEDVRFAIVDLRIGPDSGISSLDEIKKRWPNCRVVILTGYGSISTAVQAIKLGAANYLTKPVSIETLERALWIDLANQTSEAEPADRASLARHEREYIEYVLAECGGNISKAAEWLGVYRQSLQRKLKKFTPRT